MGALLHLLHGDHLVHDVDKTLEHVHCPFFELLDQWSECLLHLSFGQVARHLYVRGNTFIPSDRERGWPQKPNRVGGEYPGKVGDCGDLGRASGAGHIVHRHHSHFFAVRSL
jgi:hypothetical protein